MRPFLPVFLWLAAACLPHLLASGQSSASPLAPERLEVLKIGETEKPPQPLLVPPFEKVPPEGPVGSILRVPPKPQRPSATLNPADLRWSSGSTIEAFPGGRKSAEKRHWIEQWMFLRMRKTETCPLAIGNLQVLSPVSGPDDCRVEKPVHLAALGPGGGVRLPGLALLDCEFAMMVERFLVDDASDAALLQLGERLVSVEISQSYACGTPFGEGALEAREHHAGRAIDITAFHLDNDRVISVAESFGDRNEDGEFLDVVFRKACTHFSGMLRHEGPAEGSAVLHLDDRCDGEDCKERVCE
ncbi:extensin family protein [Stappia sp. F7233]|uniref:Extensin family protein n=1 Tax=Stappia albiluteola TaxID=2758565 RepID=A0A839AFN1_9HYPH|nr:extensin family protein [Stappia albiluteola]MBA5777838.1 extensin family protein [Stappia albiluteola]